MNFLNSQGNVPPPGLPPSISDLDKKNLTSHFRNIQTQNQHNIHNNLGDMRLHQYISPDSLLNAIGSLNGVSIPGTGGAKAGQMIQEKIGDPGANKNKPFKRGSTHMAIACFISFQENNKREQQLLAERASKTTDQEQKESPNSMSTGDQKEEIQDKSALANSIAESQKLLENSEEYKRLLKLMNIDSSNSKAWKDLIEAQLKQIGNITPESMKNFEDLIRNNMPQACIDIEEKERISPSKK